MTGQRLGLLALAALIGVGVTFAAPAEEPPPPPPLPVEIGVEGPDSCRVQVSKTMLSYACGNPDGGVFSGVVIFPTKGSILVMGSATPWNQEEVVGVATELSERLVQLNQTIAADSRDLGDEAAASRKRLVQGMVPYKAAVKNLMEELRAGKGKDETRASFENVHRTRRDLILTMGGAWSPTVETMRQIARPPIFSSTWKYASDPRFS